MIFPLIPISSAIDKVYEVPLVFFENSLRANTCSKALFPIWFRDVYTGSHGLRSKFETVFKHFKKLNKRKQRFIIDTYRSSRDVKVICSDKSILYPELDLIDASISASLKILFEFLYEQTIETLIFKQKCTIDITDHYKIFFDTNEVGVCPFCGLESYTIPEFRRAEYDHYLPIAKIPWLGVNFSNLFPMGDHCNGKKNQCNILYNDYATKNRRLAWYPYDRIIYTMSVRCIIKPSILDLRGDWEIDIHTSNVDDLEKIETWNNVFEIKLRYKHSFRRFHKRFLEDFVHKRNLYASRLTITQLKLELQGYRDNGIGNSRIEVMSKLKYLWADYYLNLIDNPHLAVLTYSIARIPKRVSP